MKSILLAFRLFYKNIKVNIAIIIQIIISTLILLILVGKIQEIHNAKSIADIIETKNTLYLSMYPHVIDNNGRPSDEFYNTINSNNSINSVGEILNVYFRLNNGESISGYAYNDSIINNINIKVQKGAWFNSEKTDYIPIISVGNTYKLNETVNFTISPNISRVGKIIGIISNNNNIITFNSGGSKGSSSLSYFITPSNNCFIMPESYLSDAELSLTRNEFGKMIFLNNNANVEESEQILSEYGGVTNVEELTNNFRTENFQFMITNGTAFLFFLILVLAGVGGINGIQNIKNERSFAIYYILGVTVKKCAIIEILRGSIIFIISFIATLILYNIHAINSIIDNGDISVNIFTFLFAFCYLIIVYFLSSAVFVLKTLRLNPIALYRKKD